MATEILRPDGVGSETAIDTQYPVTGAHWDKVDDVIPDHSIGTGDSLTKVGSTCVYQTTPDLGPKRDLCNLPAHSIGSGIIDQIEVFVVRYS